jgi:transcription termination/antitermination protein NusG
MNLRRGPHGTQSAEPCSSAQLNWTREPAPVPLPSAGENSWYAIHTRVRFEKKVAAQLEGKGIETFLPLIKQVHRWSDRRQVIGVPLFPGYGFVHIYLDLITRQRVLQTAGLLGLVACNGEAAAIPSKQIEDIQKVLTRDVPCALYPFLKAGQKVRIRGGCLDGLEGVLSDHCSDRDLLISVDAIERTIVIRVEGYEIELV